MDFRNQPLNLQELIRRYNDELLSMHNRQQPPPPEDPLPDFQRDLAAMTSSEVTGDPVFPYTDQDLNGEPPLPEDTPAPPGNGEPPFTGYLRVYVFSGNGAEPLPGARVAVSRRQGDSDTLFANVLTDRDGFTPVIPLPSVNPELTMRPDVSSPFVLYDAAVSADGFIPALYKNIPIYGNTYVTQSAALVPLIPGGDNATRVFDSGGPTNL